VAGVDALSFARAPGGNGCLEIVERFVGTSALVAPCVAD
jgi:hypothetical protein